MIKVFLIYYIQSDLKIKINSKECEKVEIVFIFVQRPSDWAYVKLS